jgi:hypothetical protein
VPFVSRPYLASLSAAERHMFLSNHIKLGYHPETRDELLIPNINRYSGTYISGMPGCLHPDTPIFDPVDGTTVTVYERYINGESFHVLALDGENIVIARAETPVRYTKASMYEISDGTHSVKVTGRHRIWDGSHYVECCLLYQSQGSSGIPLPTIGVDDLSRLQRGAQHLKSTDAGSQADYHSSRHSCDELSRQALDTAQASSPLQGDAHGPYCSCFDVGDREHKQERNRQHQYNDHPARSSCVLHAEPIPDEASHLNQYTSKSPCRSFPYAESSLAVGLPVDRGLDIELSVEESMPYPYCPLSSYSNNSLYRITRIEDEVYYDFHVPEYENYYACGLFHHNSGKSGLLENMIIQDIIAGNAVDVLDPHMDLVMRCISSLPPEDLSRVYLLDMEDEGYPFGINVFNTGAFSNDMHKARAVERILHIFEVLWPDILSQAHLPRYLRMAVHVFLANPGSTLPDMYDFLIDDAYRRKLMAQVSDPTVKQFWQLQYDSMAPAARLSRVQPLLGRLEQLFAGRTLIRNIVGQKQNSIDFRKSIERKEIIFIKLPLKLVPEDARLIGTLLVAQIHAALFSFVNMPENKRPGVSLYLDEFQNFSTPDIAELFTEGRKYGMRITVAHQYRGQLSKDMREATMNAQTKIVFQSTPEDGRELAHLFPAPSEGVRPENVDAHPVETLLNHSHLHPEVVQEFIETYLRPVGLQQFGAHGNTVELRELGTSAFDLAYGMMNGGRIHSVKVEEPTAYLDYVLQQVMVLGDPGLPIPAMAVRGFANCGHSFWQKVRGLRDDDKRLHADILSLKLPKYLAVRTPEGSWRWTRPPESGAEQLAHFLFHVRMVMRYLAEHPLGKESTVSTADVGKMLNQLPRRCAWVRSGNDTGTIYTHETAPPLSRVGLFDRIKFILEHTRAVYCRPRTEIEQRFTAPQSAGNGVVGQPMHQHTASIQPVQPDKHVSSPQPPLSGWEEV